MPEEQIFRDQADSLRQAALLLSDRMTRVEAARRSDVHLSLAAAEVSMFKVRSLRICVELLGYLAEEIEREEPTRHVFRLPHARTLMDIHARFLHLVTNCADEDKQAVTCVLYRCNTVKDLNHDSEIARFWARDKEFLAARGIQLSGNSADFPAYDSLKRKGLGFAGRKILTPDNLLSYSVHTREVYSKGDASGIYGPISEFAHGNPYYYTGVPNNHRCWVAAVTVMTTAFLLELIDQYTLGWRQPKDARDWLNVVKKRRENLTMLWRAKNLRRGEE